MKSPAAIGFSPAAPAASMNALPSSFYSEEVHCRSVSVLRVLPPAMCRGISYSLLLMFFFSSLHSLLHYSHLAVLQLLLFGLNVIYFLAFLSLIWQIDGLVKARVGLMPLDQHLPVLQQRASFAASPHVRLLMKAVYNIACTASGSKDILPSHLAMAGVCISVFGGALCCWFPSGFSRVLWQTAAFAALYVLYLSFRYIARDFLSFQWDVLLLESGFLALFAAPCASATSPFGAGVALICFRLLAFKLFLSSGLCKFASGDCKWSSFTALSFHFWTQPLPNFLSWFAHYSKSRRLQAIAVVVIELTGPLLIFFGRSSRFLAFCFFIGLMTALYVSGNYGFFPFLACVVSLSLLDDSLLLHSFSALSRQSTESVFRRATSSVAALLLGSTLFAFYLLYCLTTVALLLRVWQRPSLEPPALCARLYGELAPLHACNVYGLFASVTTSRYEIVVEELHTIETQMGASSAPTLVDAWVELNFHYKPGDVNRRPAWLWGGHMPRLDWRLWFIPLRLGRLLNAALKEGASPAAVAAALQQQHQLHHEQRQQQLQTPQGSADLLFPPWWMVLLSRVARRQPEVLQLLGPQKNIDLTRAPSPRGMRVSLYDFRFRPPSNQPLFSAFFPEGLRSLSHQQMKELDMELQQWEVGTWWMRKRHRVVDLLSIRSSVAAAPVEKSDKQTDEGEGLER